MSVGQYEPVTIEPSGVGGVMYQEVGPEHLGNVSHTHRGTGTASMDNARIAFAFSRLVVMRSLPGLGRPAILPQATSIINVE